MKTITITAMNRPHLLKPMLESLTANALQGWTIFVSIDPSFATAEAVGVCEAALAGHEHEIVVNETVLGIRANPHRVLTRAFEQGSALNLYLEEDLLISPDTTALAVWYAENHQPGWLCLNLLAGPCGSASLLSDQRYPDALFLARSFNSLGFVTRRQEWKDYIEPAWYGGSVPRFAGGKAVNWRTEWGWDWSIYGLLASSDSLFSVQPVLARATHTGRSGEHSLPSFHDRAFSNLEINRDATRSYTLIDVSDLAREARSLVFAHEEMTDLRMQAEHALSQAGAGEEVDASDLVAEPRPLMATLSAMPDPGQ